MEKNSFYEKTVFEIVSQKLDQNIGVLGMGKRMNVDRNKNNH